MDHQQRDGSNYRFKKPIRIEKHRTNQRSHSLIKKTAVKAELSFSSVSEPSRYYWRLV